ncbi:hypothetical protein MKEN_01179100 [Mycena kentingensis (nom. inval.)]|nr:hypothetical protein MKEN_01179100 [Mycena kentingensis (nom. inval.)]
MPSSQLQAAARAAYRQLFRASSTTFAGDEQVLLAFRSKMRHDAMAASQVADPVAYEQHNALGREVAKILRENIVQASRTSQPDTWKVRITEHTELGSNDSIKTAGRNKDSELPAAPLDRIRSVHYSALKAASKNRVVPELREEDLEETFVRGSGPGGQSVNKTRNNVQLVHRPTGIRITCHETRSLHTNRRIARKLLVERLDQLANPGLTRENMQQAKQRERERRRRKRAKKKQRDS